MNKKLTVIILVIAIVGAFAFFTVFDKGASKPVPNQGNSTADNSDNNNNQNQYNNEDNQNDEIVNTGRTIIFYGTDTSVASDAIMMFNIDDKSGEVKVCSFYRDCLMNIEGYGYEKIKYAFQHGGGDLAVSTLNDNLDLSIEDYIAFDFDDLETLIDMVGGVEVDVTDNEAKAMKKMGTDISESGTQTLNGAQALTYCRIRKQSGGDYARTQRQRNILFKLFSSAKNLDVNERISFAEQMMDQLESSMPNQEVTEIMADLSKYTLSEVGAFPEVFYGGMIDDLWVEVPMTLEDMSKAVHLAVYNDDNYTPSDKVKKYSEELSAMADEPNKFKYNN